MAELKDLAAMAAKAQAERGSSHEATVHDMVQICIAGALRLGYPGPTVGLEALAQGFALIIDRPVYECRSVALELIQALVSKLALHMQPPEGAA